MVARVGKLDVDAVPLGFGRCQEAFRSEFRYRFAQVAALSMSCAVDPINSRLSNKRTRVDRSTDVNFAGRSGRRATREWAASDGNE
jgi:hypothetical protein